MKKLPVFVMIVIVYMGMLTGCGQSYTLFADDARFHIVCTTFPQYDWTVHLIQGNESNISVTLLMDNGGDLHNFQPSALDIAKVSGCDLFIYVGGESDSWVEDALKEAVNPDMRVVNMMDIISERLVESVHEDHGHEEHAKQEYDEHVWLSLKNAAIIVERIEKELVDIDSENADLYQKNCENYLAEVRALDIQYMETVRKSGGGTLLFADRFPFRYLVEDYGLQYEAAFDGCSAETEASFETVASLANKLDSLSLHYVVVLEGSDDRLARVIIENAGTRNQEILVLNSLQSVSQKEIKAGLSYLNVMEENLKVLRQALRNEKKCN